MMHDDRRGRRALLRRACMRPGACFPASADSSVPGVGEDTNYELSISPLATAPKLPRVRKRDRERAERLRLAGGPKPSLRERAVALAQERGMVRTRDLTDIGIPRCYLTRMCDEGLLINIGYGLYRAAEREAA
jgi:hypothetical protein